MSETNGKKEVLFDIDEDFGDNLDTHQADMDMLFASLTEQGKAIGEIQAAQERSEATQRRHEHMLSQLIKSDAEIIRILSVLSGKKEE